MKLTTLLMVVALLQVQAKGVSQSVTFSGKNTPVKLVFSLITEQTGYDIFGKLSLLDKARPVSVNVTDMPLADFMKIIMKDQPFSYQITEKTIILSEKIEFKKTTITQELEKKTPITGIVRGPDGQSLGGVNIIVKGTKKGTTSSGDGKFAIEAKEGDVLIFTSIGYGLKEVRIGTNNEIGVVQLMLSDSKLDEVQIIAYGTTTQRLNTGNVTTVKADVIEKQPVNNPLLALQGRVPGLFIEQSTGFAGTGVKVRIQGQNSIGNGNDPLYVIDGAPYTPQLLPGTNVIVGNSYGGYGSPLSFINPLDIERIDVLKDADATAIYGSRAANGAILITTKKGKSGDIKVNVNVQNGWGEVSNRLNLMNTHQYLEMRREALKNDNIDLNAYPYNTDLYKRQLWPDLSGFFDTTRSIDWQKELIGGSAIYQDAQATISGGSGNTVFLAGVNYHKEGNVFPGDYHDTRGSVHFSINSTSLNQKFQIQLTGTYLADNNQLPSVDLTVPAMTLAPMSPPLLNPDGSINWLTDSVTGETQYSNNPMIYLFEKYKNKTANILGNAMIGYEIIPGLNIKSRFSYTNLRTDIINTKPLVTPDAYLWGKRSTIFTNSTFSSWSIEPQVTYNRTIGNGKLEVLVASTIQSENRSSSSINAAGFATDNVMEDLKSATEISLGYDIINSGYRYNALFGRLNYNWRDKFILNLTGRRDGSSRFGPKNRFHNFGAVGAAWIFSQENFFSKNLPFLSYGKLRGSFGTTGNDQIADYQYLSLYDAIWATAPYQGVKGYGPTRLTNPYLQWEETKKLQVGLELGFFKDRILLNTNYSLNRSSNQLLGTGLPITTGFGGISANLPATLQNTGWEITLSTTNVKTRYFTWSSSVNITLPKNKLVSFPDFENSYFSSWYVIGKSININRLYHFLGVDPVTGFYQFADKDGHSVASPKDPEDKTMIIITDPKFYGGFQNSFSYKGLQLDILFQFTKQIGQNNNFGSTSVPGKYTNGGNNQLVTQLNRWQKPGDIATIQRYTTNFSAYTKLDNARRNSDAGWSDASYVRLKNVALSWQLPQAWKNAAHLNNCKLFAQAQNVLTFTNYNGLDPETKSSSALPPLRIVTLGIQIGL